MAVNLSPVGGVAAQFFTNTGAVLTGGKIYTYAAGTTTPAATFTSSAGSTPWSNPIVLDAAGRVSGSGEIWLTDGINYKFLLKDSNDVLIATYDNISGINSNFVAYTNSQEIITATANQTVFNLSISYQPGTNSLSVFVDGVNQYGPGAQYAYTETDSDTVTFVSGLHVGAQVKFTTTQQQGAGAVNASQVTYNPAGTGAVATNVQAKLRETVSVKDFGAVGNGVVNDTAAIQAAYNYLANQGGGKVIWPRATYYVTGTIIFGGNTETDGCKSRINANGQLLFDTGYLSSGVLVSNNATAVGDYSTAVFNSSIGNFTVYDADDVFRLFKFLSNSRIHDIECQNTTGRLIRARECFYSNFERLIRYGTANDGIAGTGNFTLGSNVATVANATAAQLSIGMVFRTTAAFPVATTTITNVGAANSGGAGLTNVTLSQVSNLTVSAGGANSGFVAISSANIIPLYEFTTANSNIVFNKCSAAARFLGWSLNEVNSSTFISPDITACTIGMQFTGSCTANTITAAYVENVKNYVYDCTAASAAASLDIGPSNYFNCAGVITAGLTGQVSGTLNLGATVPGYTPYGFSSAGSSFIDLNSVNAKMVVLGGPTDLAGMNGVSTSGGMFQHGVWMPNSPVTDTRVLDYYLEGTWTPVIEGASTVGAGTYTNQYGTYTRIGNRVYYTFSVSWSAHTGTGRLLLANLPFITAILVARPFPVNAVGTAGSQFYLTTGGVSFTKPELVTVDATGALSNVNIYATGTILGVGHYEV
jgi:hypothetical protein